MENNPQYISEPPVQPDDTRPTGTFSRVEAENIPHPDPSEQPLASWRQMVGFISLVGALFFTVATVIVLLLPMEDDEPNEPIVALPINEAPALQPAQAEIVVVPTSTPIEVIAAMQDGSLPLLDTATAAQLLQEPPVDMNRTVPGQIKRETYKPFTIIPDRPRNEIIHYTVVQGDTIGEIAERFGLAPESIAWSNPRRLVQVLRPGDVLNIPPVDGVTVMSVGSTKTIADYAQLYKISDPYLVLDSQFNDLTGYSLDEAPPSGTRIFIPGGIGEEVVWSIQVEGDPTSSGGGTAGGGSVATVSFQSFSPGSCGPQAIVGGSFWSHPIPSGGYTITQGFSSWHTAIDLGGAEGTPIVSANGGRVVFSGWDNSGYGWMVAIVHGPSLTVYAHLKDIAVGCGQDVASGQLIGWMGNSGNSSGAHLHFEIRMFQSGGGYVAGNPSATLGF